MPFSRKLCPAKQNEKGILVNSFMKTQHFAGLSLLLVYAVEVVKHHHLKLIYVVIVVRVFIFRRHRVVHVTC